MSAECMPGYQSRLYQTEYHPTKKDVPENKQRSCSPARLMLSGQNPFPDQSPPNIIEANTFVLLTM